MSAAKAEKTKTVSKPKFKSAANENSKEEGQKEWKQPLRRHINPDTQQVEFVTILVRVLSGDSEHDFHARFPSTVLYAKAICSAIAERERLSDDEAKLFRLWVVSKDLEIQLRPDQDVFGLMVFWNRWMMKYTHFPEAANAQHSINRHWFVYRRAADITLKEERSRAGEEAVNLLFGEAKRNILTRKYVCTQLEASTIAGYQLQMAYGDYNTSRSKPGYLTEDDRLFQLLPFGMADKMRPSQWEEIITVQYKTLMGFTGTKCRTSFLDFLRNMPCYGCSFFPCCAELPPSGFFEFRTQNWFVGVGPNGVCIVDADIQKYVYILAWSDISFRTGPDVITIIQNKNGKTKEIALISPQGKIIENLAIRIQYKWAKENGRLKSNQADELKEVVVEKSSRIDDAKGGKLEKSKTKSLSSNALAEKSDKLKASNGSLQKIANSAEGIGKKLGKSAEKLGKLMNNSGPIPVDTEKVQISHEDVRTFNTTMAGKAPHAKSTEALSVKPAKETAPATAKETAPAPAKHSVASQPGPSNQPAVAKPKQQLLDSSHPKSPSLAQQSQRQSAVASPTPPHQPALNGLKAEHVPVPPQNGTPNQSKKAVRPVKARQSSGTEAALLAQLELAAPLAAESAASGQPATTRSSMHPASKGISHSPGTVSPESATAHKKHTSVVSPQVSAVVIQEEGDALAPLQGSPKAATKKVSKFSKASPLQGSGNPEAASHNRQGSEKDAVNDVVKHSPAGSTSSAGSANGGRRGSIRDGPTG
ncbi:hypothetical protein HDU91_000221, partial [Kappamyces sp. JEL0680]